MMYSVEELFSCFHSYFDNIVYYDQTNNVKDSVYIKDYTGEYNEDEYSNFLDEYRGCNVVDWEYFAHGNYIDITFESESNAE